MATIVAEPTEISFKPDVSGLLDLAGAIGVELEPFQRKTVRAVLGDEREALILEPRGNGKSSLMALVAIHHLLSVEGAAIYCVAASVPQARILYEYAADYARRLDHPNLVFRHLELRYCPDPDEATVFTRHMRVLGAEAPRLHGLSPSLMVLDELQAVTREGIYEALASALHKRPDAKLVTISTAGQGADSPLGRLRARALGLPDVRARGALTDCRGPDLRALLWEVPDDANIDRVAEVKKANPASWITTKLLREQRKRLPELMPELPGDRDLRLARQFGDAERRVRAWSRGQRPAMQPTYLVSPGFHFLNPFPLRVVWT